MSKILIVDDDELVGYTLGEICSFAGWEYTYCNNGRDALTAFHQHDVVLVDYHMPEWDGLQTVRELRKIDTSVPVIVLTVDERQEIAEQFLAEGATDFALKPVKAPDLIARIQIHFKLVQLTRSLQAAVHEHTEDVFVAKGISKSTLSYISDFLQKNKKCYTVEEISKELGLAYPTIYRYVMYLLKAGKIQSTISYQKVGRPKNKYQWIFE